jgi:two-component system response regulator QseB
MRVLLVEDDEMIGTSLRAGLRQDGFTIDWVQSAETAQDALATTSYDMMLLDLGLPGRSGLEFLESLRRNKMHLPVLIVTARDAVADRVAGLNAGADDYLIKPFDISELVARMHALQRRLAGRSDSMIEFGDVVINPAERSVARAGRPVALSAREYALLMALAERPGAVLSRAQLEDKLYGWGDEIGSNTIEVYIHALRKKLGADLIRNVRGVGYTVPRP